MYGSSQTHDTMHNGHGNGFMVGLLCGTAVGAAIGLLLAPKSGSDLRSQLAESAGRLRNRAGSAYDEATAKVESVIDEGREAVRRGREKFDEVRRTATDASTGSAWTDSGRTPGEPI